MIEPLTITAHLASGFVASDPWSPALDGLLAYHLLRERLGDEAFALGSSGVTETIVLDDLPLGREEFGGLWWWQCSSPIVEQAGAFVRYQHRRFDALQAETFTATKRVNTAAGPFKAYRMPHQVTITHAITWHALGDGDEIRRLLRLCFSVGRRRNSGEGTVREWQIEPGGDPALARFYRPLPVEFAEAEGVPGTRMQWGIKPPARLREHQALCVLP